MKLKKEIRKVLIRQGISKERQVEFGVNGFLDQHATDESVTGFTYIKPKTTLKIYLNQVIHSVENKLMIYLYEREKRRSISDPRG